MNPDIWGEIKNDTRHKDLQFLRTIQVLKAGMIPLVECANYLKKFDNVDKKNRPFTASTEAYLGNRLNKGMLLLAEVIHDINIKRRDNNKPELSQECGKILTANENVITTQLFGDDPQKVAKEATEGGALVTALGSCATTTGTMATVLFSNFAATVTRFSGFVSDNRPRLI